MFGVYDIGQLIEGLCLPWAGATTSQSGVGLSSYDEELPSDAEVVPLLPEGRSASPGARQTLDEIQDLGNQRFKCCMRVCL